MSSNEWHTILPYTPPVQLRIREITSVSVAFLLSSPLSLRDSSESSDEEPDSDPEDEDEDDSERRRMRKPIATALGNGLNVSVNGDNWDRVLIRVDEKTDEAIIIIYNLLPARQYDIDLAFVPSGEELRVLREVVVTDDLETSPSNLHNSSSEPTSPERSAGTLSSNSSPSPQPPPLLTLEDHLAHLHQTLANTTTERDNLSTSIKNTRRESQKAEASLKAEIDKLRSLSEKHGSHEQRAKQRTLALQEAVKRAQNATTEIEETAREVEKEVPSLQTQLKAKELEHSKVLSSHTKTRMARERAEKENSRIIEGLENELKGLENKSERLAAKKERIETVVIHDLEQKLKEIEDEIERVERESQPPPLWAPPGSTPSLPPSTVIPEDPLENQIAFPTSTRHRYSSSQPPVTSPRPAPIQRPSPPNGPSRTVSQPLPTEPPTTSTKLSSAAAPFQPRFRTSTTASQQGSEKRITILQNPARLGSA